jgi:hypothetical protein
MQSGGKTAGQIKLVLKHFGNILGGNKAEAVRPVARAEGGDWQRLGPGKAEDLSDGRCNVVWLIEAPQSYVDIAFCYPYGRPELDVLLAETDGHWQAETIGVSQGAQPLLRLSNSYGADNGERPGIYLIARQHSGETPGSWVLDGFLRHIAALGEKAPLVWAVPLSNIDGVEQGDYGKDNFPYDLNRAWGGPPMRHEVLVIQRDMRRWQKRCRPALAIDFHAPGATETDGIYMYLPNPERYREQSEQVAKWGELIAAGLTLELASDKARRVAQYASRWETPNFTAYCCNTLKTPALTIETPYALVRDVVLTRELYRKAGQRIATAVVERRM